MDASKATVAAAGLLAALFLSGCDRQFAVLALELPSVSLTAQEPAAPPKKAAVRNDGYEGFLLALGKFESGGRTAIDYAHPGNPAGYIGGWQFGEAALIDAGFYAGDRTPDINDWKGSWTGLEGIGSKKAFLASEEAQWIAIRRLMPLRWAAMKRMGLDRYVGRKIKGVEITEAGLLAAAHLMGPGGVRDFLRSNGRTDPADGNDTPVSRYMARFSGRALPDEPQDACVMQVSTASRATC